MFGTRLTAFEISNSYSLMAVSAVHSCCMCTGVQSLGVLLPAHHPEISCVQQREAEEEEEDEQEVLALPAPGDYLSQEGQLEADMHAAIASAELVSYAQVGLSTISPLQTPPTFPMPPALTASKERTSNEVFPQHRRITCTLYVRCVRGASCMYAYRVLENCVAIKQRQQGLCHNIHCAFFGERLYAYCGAVVCLNVPLVFPHLIVHTGWRERTSQKFVICK